MKIVPLISSSVAGPLGVLHLPRLWLKLSLKAIERLAPCRDADADFDKIVTDGLHVNAEKMAGFVKTHKPSYPDFEMWVQQQSGVRLDEISLDKVNASIRVAIVKRNYNDMDDWREFHKVLVEIPQNAGSLKFKSERVGFPDLHTGAPLVHCPVQSQ